MSRRKTRKPTNPSKKNAKPSTPKGEPTRSTRGPIRITGILFALAANLFLVSAADALVQGLSLPVSYEVLATLIAPFIAGVTTAFYVKQRGGIHAFIGGLVSVPLLTYLVFGGFWQFGVLAGAFCGLSGAITEIFLRRGQTEGH